MRLLGKRKQEHFDVPVQDMLLRITGPTGLVALAAGVVAAIGVLVATAPAARGPAPG